MSFFGRRKRFERDREGKRQVDEIIPWEDGGGGQGEDDGVGLG